MLKNIIVNSTTDDNFSNFPLKKKTFLYSAGVEISRFLSIFALNSIAIELVDGINTTLQKGVIEIIFYYQTWRFIMR